jgi:PAS domain S-box-containing protein
MSPSSELRRFAVHVDAVLLVDETLAVDEATVRELNDEAARLLRRSREEILGARLRDVVELQGGFPGGPLDEAGRPTLFLDAAAILPGGLRQPVHVWRRPAVGGSAIILRDASAWAERTAALALVVTAVEQAADSFEITDAAGRVEYANAAHERLTGYPLFEALGERITRGIEDEELLNRIDRALAKGEGFQGEIVCRARDGSLRTQELTVAAVEDRAAPVGPRPARARRFVAVRRDLGARLAAEWKIDELREALARAGRMSLIGQTAASVARDVSVPATFILESLRQAGGELKEIDDALAARGEGQVLEQLRRVRQRLEEVVVGTEQMAQLVEKLKLMAQPSAPPGPAAGPVSIHEVVRDALQLSRGHARGRAAIHAHLGEVPPAHIDRVQLGQVVTTLVMNASQAIPAGGDDRHRIDVHTFTRGDQIVLTVTDTGDGIRPEHLARVFDPEFTTKSADERDGLDLAIAREIVEAHGGTITVESEWGKGACFTVTLPVTPPVTPPVRPPSRP